MSGTRASIVKNGFETSNWEDKATLSTVAPSQFLDLFSTKIGWVFHQRSCTTVSAPMSRGPAPSNAIDGILEDRGSLHKGQAG